MPLELSQTSVPPSASKLEEDLISLFPLESYSQSPDTWLNPHDPGYDQPLLTAQNQQSRLDLFYHHYFGSFSPWEAGYLESLLSQPYDISALEQNLLKGLGNQDKPEDRMGYAENFHPHPQTWIDPIEKNINLTHFQKVAYHPSKRGITVDNLHVRHLPTEDVHFYSYKLAGQGYPFDNLQMSVLWVGTPVYVVGETQDGAWALIVAPECIGWVKRNGVALAHEDFIKAWKRAARKSLAAITRTQVSLIDQGGRFLGYSYVGAIFPGEEKSSQAIKLQVPQADAEGFAISRDVILSVDDCVLMPLSPTPRNFSRIMKTLVGRPYGWGGLYFYNDCSSELKNLFTPFGLWLPRNSVDQPLAGKVVDIAHLSAEERITYLKEKGKNLLTLIYNGGHIFLYVGTYPGAHHKDADRVMTYQNIWGLSPIPSSRRCVIGQSVFLPLLLQYPEDPKLASLAARRAFRISYLDHLPSMDDYTKPLNIKSLGWPGHL